MPIVPIRYPNFIYNLNISFPYIFWGEPFILIMDISEPHTLIHNDRLLLCYHEACLAGTRPVDRNRLYVHSTHKHVPHTSKACHHSVG